MLIKAELYNIKNVSVPSVGEPTTIEFKISHFRNYTSKQIIKNGGYTCLSMVEDGKPFSIVSRCSAKETFNRKRGVDECLRKYLQRTYGNSETEVLLSIDRKNPRHYIIHFSIHLSVDSVIRSHFKDQKEN